MYAFTYLIHYLNQTPMSLPIDVSLDLPDSLFESNSYSLSIVVSHDFMNHFINKTLISILMDVSRSFYESNPHETSNTYKSSSYDHFL